MIKIVPVVIVNIVDSVNTTPGLGTAGRPEIGPVMLSRKKLIP
jgi:hypothetical protein